MTRQQQPIRVRYLPRCSDPRFSPRLLLLCVSRICICLATVATYCEWSRLEEEDPAQLSARGQCHAPAPKTQIHLIQPYRSSRRSCFRESMVRMNSGSTAGGFLSEFCRRFPLNQPNSTSLDAALNTVIYLYSRI
jgi:hypothetical protein